MSAVTRCTVVLSLFLFLLSLAPAQNVSVSDYQIPTSSAKKIIVNGSYGWTGTSDTTSANNFNADLLYNQFYSSRPFAWSINANGNTAHSLNTDWQYTTSVVGKANKYFSDDQDWFGLGELDFAYAKIDSQPEVDATIGGGYGRLYFVTSLAKAVRIEDLLMKENVLKEHMPKETMIKIANIIDRENEYAETYGSTYEVQWFSDIEKEIKGSGALTGEDLGALGLFRIRQVLFPGETNSPPVNTRYFGWNVDAGIAFQLLNPFKQDLAKPALTVGGEYAYPIDWSMQLHATAKVNTPVDSSFFKAVNVNGSVDYLYELSNRISFFALYNLIVQKPSVGNSITSHGVSASFLFYIENNINYQVGASLNKSGSNSAVMGLNMSLQYRLQY